LQDLKGFLELIQEAIDTPLLRIDQEAFASVERLAQALIRKNLERVFTEFGPPEADLRVEMSNHSFCLRYESSSGTQVGAQICLNESQELSNIWVEVRLPVHRAHTGRVHYEQLTHMFYQWAGPDQWGPAHPRMPIGELGRKLWEEGSLPMPKWVTEDSEEDEDPEEDDEDEGGLIPEEEYEAFVRAFADEQEL